MEEQTLTFEQAMNKLQAILERLEAGEETLDDSIKLFEEGAKLSSFCYDKLKTAEQKINQIVEKESDEHV